MATTAIILAGGKSSRFGSDKSLLMLQEKLIVQRLAECCSTFADEVLIVSNQSGKFKIAHIRELYDIYPEMGPLGGIHAGLCAASGNKIFVTACDMPFFQVSLAKEMLKQIGDYQAVVPCYGQHIEPLFSAFEKASVLPVVENLLKKNQTCMKHLFEQINTFYWECSAKEHDGFYNINYKEDYETLLQYKMA